ncbi:MAG TPA: C39 family peptidase, partial [Anaerolineaceae bacterium]|nr:C39 family peptidase [Anaerolineaceae bacterium]
YNDAHGQIPPNSYGVHAEPVAQRLRAYGLSAEAIRPFTLDGLKQELANGRPVMVWVIGPVWPGSGVSYTAPSTDNTSQVAYFEHTVLVIGYGVDYLTFLDGGITYWRTYETFASSWGAMNNMAIIIKP